MSKIFDLSSIQRLVDNKHPKAIAIVDTNVIFKEPDFIKWDTAIGETLFVLSDTIVNELEHLKKKPDSRERAITAVNSMTRLLMKGAIGHGIEVEKVGWFISPPSPPTENARNALAQFQDIVNAFGESDTKLLILAQELNQILRDVPIVLVTGDKNLFNIAEVNRVPSCLFESFPLVGFERAGHGRRTQPIDWDTVLEDIQETTRKSVVQVALTLTGKRVSDKESYEDISGRKRYKYAVAEGIGIIGSQTFAPRKFHWSVHFRLCDLGSFERESMGDSQMDSVTIDFSKPDQRISENIVNELKERIKCLGEARGKTLQAPHAVMEMELCEQFSVLGEEPSQEELDSAREELEKAGGLTAVWRHRILEHFDPDFELERLLNALDACWILGETIEFTMFQEMRLPKWLKDALQ